MQIDIGPLYAEVRKTDGDALGRGLELIMRWVMVLEEHCKEIITPIM